MTDDATRPRLGRPTLTDEQISARIAAYCARYRVEATDTGLPPFPSGKRETRQHREWLALYRAARRRTGREASASTDAASKAPSRTCGLCGQRLDSDGAAFLRRGAKTPVRLHEACSQLVFAAETAGPEAVARLATFISTSGRSRRS